MQISQGFKQQRSAMVSLIYFYSINLNPSVSFRFPYYSICWIHVVYVRHHKLIHVFLWLTFPSWQVNILAREKNGHNFAEDIFKCISSTKISPFYILNFTEVCSRDTIWNNSGLHIVMAWRGRNWRQFMAWKPIAPMHIFVTRPQWVNMKVIFLCPDSISHKISYLPTLRIWNAIIHRPVTCSSAANPCRLRSQIRKRYKILHSDPVFLIFAEIPRCNNDPCHYSDVLMRAMASQITGVSTVCSAVCSGADQRKHQSSASLAFVRGIHRWPVNSPHKGPVTRKMSPFDDVIMDVMCQITFRFSFTLRWLPLDFAGFVPWNFRTNFHYLFAINNDSQTCHNSSDINNDLSVIPGLWQLKSNYLSDISSCMPKACLNISNYYNIIW